MIKIVQRQMSVVVGTLQRAAKGYAVEPMRGARPESIAVIDAAGAVPGDRVLVELADWTDPASTPHGKITGVIGPADDPALDTISVIHSFELPDAFPPAAARQAQLRPIVAAEQPQHASFEVRRVGARCGQRGCLVGDSCVT